MRIRRHKAKSEVLSNSSHASLTPRLFKGQQFDFSYNENEKLK